VDKEQGFIPFAVVLFVTVVLGGAFFIIRSNPLEQMQQNPFTLNTQSLSSKNTSTPKNILESIQQLAPKFASEVNPSPIILQPTNKPMVIPQLTQNSSPTPIGSSPTTIQTNSPSPTLSTTPSPTPQPTVALIPTTSQTINLKLLSPNGGESFKVGDKINISWQASIFNQIIISYINAVGSENQITTVYNSGSGIYEWVVDIGNTTNNNFKIKLTGIKLGSGATTLEDQSDNYFTINKN